jgi:hypothetical protein
MYGSFDEGNIGNSGLWDHETPSLEFWLSSQWFQFVWNSEAAPGISNLSVWWKEDVSVKGEYLEGHESLVMLVCLLFVKEVQVNLSHCYSWIVMQAMTGKKK